jgi:RNA ligase
MKLAEYLDTTKLRHYISIGLVTERFHKTLPLAIYCYGRKAVYDGTWDEITTKTRGLIVDRETGDIVARPYEKFFAYNTEGRKETYDRNVEAVEKEFGPPIITEKVNGCLGTFWRYGIHWGIASKGSFHSPHAEFATKWMEEHIEKHGKLIFPEGYTPVFEIICQEIQPHVIKYPEDGLVLLSFVNIETGEELSQGEVDYYAEQNRLISPYTIDCGLEAALQKDSDRYEGLVATYNRPGRSPLKLKIKFPTFLKNRKIFYDELKKAETPGNDAKYKEIHDKAVALVQESLVRCTERKEFADFFNQPENAFYAPACFALLDYDEDKEKLRKIIWKLVEKRYDNYQV